MTTVSKGLLFIFISLSFAALLVGLFAALLWMVTEGLYLVIEIILALATGLSYLVGV